MTLQEREVLSFIRRNGGTLLTRLADYFGDDYDLYGIVRKLEKEGFIVCSPFKYEDVCGGMKCELETEILKAVEL